MVYFGERRFRSAQPGVTSREKSRVVVPAFLLLVLAIIIAAKQWNPGGGGEPAGIPVRSDSTAASIPATGEGAGGSAAGVSTERGGQIPPPREISVLEQNREPGPFDPDASPLAAVRDDEIPAPGDRERDGLIWLFHRWRSGPAVRVGERDVPWAELPTLKSEIRGERHHLNLTLIEEPIPRSLPVNPSGVRRYWEVFATDHAGHFVRLDFIDKPRILPAETEVEVDADFLRLHRYQMVQGGEAAVPEWVARTVTIHTSPPPEPANWEPLIWVGAISLLGLIPLIWGILRRQQTEQRPRLRSRRRRSGGGTAAPSSPEHTP